MRKIQVELFSSDDLNIVQYLCEITRGANRFDSVEAMHEHIKNKPWDDGKINQTLQLPHSKLGRFTDMTFLITGASRRFLAQITTHHVGISFMSGSLQYSDWSKHSLEDQFCVPYELIGDNVASTRELFLSNCKSAMDDYDFLAKCTHVGNDAAGYVAPQALRNILAVKVNLEALRYVGQQRLCRRNTTETIYVVGLMCLAAERKFNLPNGYFMPPCYAGKCDEGKYTCGRPLNKYPTLLEYLQDEFKLIDIK